MEYAEALGGLDEAFGSEGLVGLDLFDKDFRIHAGRNLDFFRFKGLVGMWHKGVATVFGLSVRVWSK